MRAHPNTHLQAHTHRHTHERSSEGCSRLLALAQSREEGKSDRKHEEGMWEGVFVSREREGERKKTKTKKQRQKQVTALCTNTNETKRTNLRREETFLLRKRKRAESGKCFLRILSNCRDTDF